MGGGGKRRPFNKSTKQSKKQQNNQSLFVEGGILSGFNLPNTPPSTSRPGKNGSSRSGNGVNWKSKSVPKTTFAYGYSSLNPQGGVQSESSTVNRDSNKDFSGSQPVILLGSRDNNIIAYEDPSPSMGTSVVNYNYEYSSGFVLGESSHTGLVSSDEQDMNLDASELSSGVIDEGSQLHRGLGFRNQAEAGVGIVVSSSVVTREVEEDDTGSMDEDVPELAEKSQDKTPKARKNYSFVSIGGMKLYTEDISDVEGEDDEEDEEEEDEDEDEDSSDDGSSSDSSESDDSDDSSDFDSDIDEDVMEDYVDGIGGSSQLLKSKWLALQNLDGQQENEGSDDNSSDDEYGDTLEKLSGVGLQEASRRYGLPKQKDKKKTFSKHSKSKGVSADWSPPLDDLMLIKDPRRHSVKKKQTAGFPQSWPSQGRKSKKFGWYPGEKKKQRKEMIAVKRRHRMLRRGVDLEQINLKLKQMVLNNADILSFQPMHSRDCSQVQRLASIYSLKSGCQSAGKKRFVIVSRTPHTSMPSTRDKVRLDKLLGAGKDAADFALVDTPQKSGNRSAQSRSFKKSASHQGSSSRNETRSSGKKPEAYASQPVSFVSSGVMESDSVKVSAIELKDDSNHESKATDVSSVAVGTFEVHTTGFGSKMMAKMGYVEGGGLGKEGRGMSQPIEVIQRPKSLGLGMSFDESMSEPATVSKRQPVKKAKRSGGSAPRKPNPAPSIGYFEQHTKGFGSKMMAKMGFIEGSGLGRDCQGIVNPLSAVRRPKARGLGAEDKRS